MEFESGAIVIFTLVNESDDTRISALLLWAYNHFVYNFPNNDVVEREELVFIVKEGQVFHDPKWFVRIKCFCILEQENAVFTFELHRPDLIPEDGGNVAAQQ